jgi:transcriptional regulator with XRE-family HTH domain
VAGTIHSREYQALIALLRDAREGSGLSQADLAHRLGRPQSWVSKVEIGERRLDLEELRQVCEALDVDILGLVRKWLKTL